MLDIDGAVEASWPDEGVAAHYGDPLREQRVMAAEGALVDRSNRGVITVTGPDRLSWLHSLTSQHLEQLKPGQTAQALILNPQGHLEHHLTLADDGSTTWIHVEPGTAPAVAAYLDSMRFMLRVQVQDASERYALLSFAGGLPDGAVARAFTDLGGVAMMEGPFCSDVVIERDGIAAAPEKLGLPVAGIWALEAARIAAHVARPGLDTDHKTLPHEVGLIEPAVHLNKGCYRGQETVARVHNLGHPPRRLVFLHLDGSVDRLPAHGSPVTRGPQGDEVGFVGSAALHYELGPIGLGLVKRSVPVQATLLADGVAAGQEVIVSPEAGGNVKVTLRRDSVPQPPAAARKLI
ncbi:MAG TPA: folate-binding protein [Trebonia sp.]|nr:folate-binding protein [Trebonia sp.]